MASRSVPVYLVYGYGFTVLFEVQHIWFFVDFPMAFFRLILLKEWNLCTFYLPFEANVAVLSRLVGRGSNIDFIHHCTFFEITKFSKILSKLTFFSKIFENFVKFRKYFRKICNFEKNVNGR